jgi:AraC family transcriptional regulator
VIRKARAVWYGAGRGGKAALRPSRASLPTEVARFRGCSGPRSHWTRSRFVRTANMNSNDIFLQPGSSTSDATSHAVDDSESISERDQLDSSDILASLLATATVALNTDRRVTQKCIRRAAALLGIDLSPREGANAERTHLKGGLAPWQAKRLRCYIEDKLDSAIRATNLAGLVQLSTSHFFRAFRKTFGDTPVAYIMKRRMLRAQELMLKSRISLSQVALECGMCDQAHFSRTFRRIVGTSPTVWRRQLLLHPTFGEDGSRAAQRAAADSSSNGLGAPVVIAPLIQRALERGNEHVCESD